MSVSQQAASSEDEAAPQQWGTLYDVLQVLPTADAAVVEAAYQALLPDGPRPTVQRSELDFVSRQIQQAYAILGDARRRKAYDLKLRAQQYTSQSVAPQKVRRKTACWRCKATVEPHVPYCGLCHWLVCEQCRACGCENPDWHPPTARSGRNSLVLLGWPLAGLLGVALLVVLSTRPAAAPSEARAAPAPIATPAVATAVSPPPAAPPEPALDRRPESIAPPTSAPVEPTVATVGREADPPVAVAAVPTGAPTVAPTGAPTAAPPIATTVPATHPTAAPSPSASSLPSPPESQIATDGQGARLRATPGLQGQIIAVLADRTRVVSLGQDSSQDGQLWRHVRAADGREGWVADAVLEPAPPINR